ncbi:npp1 domain protein [Colletotrichum camelliae]|nr:npp1 domain protein [Colletotrichum camelliae]
MMLRNFQPLLGCLLLSRCVVSSILPRAGDDAGGHNWLDHDKIVPFTQNASPGFDGQLELRFNPNLYVSGGCDPYAAVDSSGNLGAGLKPTGGGRDGCGDGKGGQVYVRRGVSQGRVGIMYSYYFPKVRWAKGNDNGHRHYWASIVVWINRWGCDVDDATSAWPVGVSFTTDHLKWGVAKAGDITFKSSGVGVDMPTPQALADVKYEKTEVPFVDANFQRQLDAAYQESFYGGLSDQQGCVEEEASPADEAQPLPTAQATNPVRL